MFDTASIRRLEKGPVWSLPRLVLDVALWSAVAELALHTQRGWVTLLSIAFIGAFPMHDILFHSHEGAHGRIVRTKWLNEVLSCLTHALFGLSGSGYRNFHLAHHRFAQTDRDPEMMLMNWVAKGAPGYAWLSMPLASYVGVNVWPFRKGGSPGLRLRVVLDLMVIVALHTFLVLLLGWRIYLTFLLAPAATSLSLVVIARSICEHHATTPGDRYTNTRTIKAPWLLDFLWSNANYHLEHHLFPAMPFHNLPAVRRMLKAGPEAERVVIESGYVRTALRLLRERRHFLPAHDRMQKETPMEAPLVRTSSLPFRVKKHLFRDILRCPAARRHLWSVYFAGEAYEELHPDGVYIDKLSPRLGKLLTRHLADETRHATIFRSFLAANGQNPVRVPRQEDVGWSCLNAVVPDVVAKGLGHEPFSKDEAARYMAFLHTLELRSLSDLFALIAAARSLGEEELALAIERITKDERFHATYTHRAVFELTEDAAEARRILDSVRSRERKAYTECMRTMLTHFAELGAAPNRLLDRTRWTLTALLVRTGLAFPLIPRFERMPRRLFV